LASRAPLCPSRIGSPLAQFREGGIFLGEMSNLLDATSCFLGVSGFPLGVTGYLLRMPNYFLDATRHLLSASR
jgi:hypothetical protein